jgi:hypothetical protein
VLFTTNENDHVSSGAENFELVVLLENVPLSLTVTLDAERLAAKRRMAKRKFLIGTKETGKTRFCFSV